MWCQIKTASKMITKQELKEQWAGRLLEIKALLLQFSQLMRMGYKPTKEQIREFDRLLEEKARLERLIEELDKQN